MKIVQPFTVKELDDVRALMRAFVDWHRQRHATDINLINAYFDEDAFAAELTALPGKYAPPNGRLFLALQDDIPAGCVALREVDGEAGEMKRMFVYPQFQGRGLGRALAEKVIHEARLIGYSSLRLDTGPKQVEAQGLYRSLGFKTIAPYYPVPDFLKNWLLFFQLDL